MKKIVVVASVLLIAFLIFFLFVDYTALIESSKRISANKQRKKIEQIVNCKIDKPLSNIKDIFFIKKSSDSIIIIPLDSQEIYAYESDLSANTSLITMKASDFVDFLPMMYDATNGTFSSGFIAAHLIYDKNTNYWKAD